MTLPEIARIDIRGWVGYSRESLWGRLNRCLKSSVREIETIKSFKGLRNALKNEDVFTQYEVAEILGE